MNALSVFILSIFMVLLCTPVKAQSQKPDSPATHAGEWTSPDEHDILWRKRVDRDLDITAVANQVFINPRTSFINLLIEGIKSEKIMAYSAANDSLTTMLNKDDLAINATTQFERYRIKEDWMFDKQSGKMVIHIVGIAPMKLSENTDATRPAYRPAFWINYANVRGYLAQKPAGETPSDSTTWYDYFERRLFSSKIVKLEGYPPPEKDVWVK